eukprot:3707523-Alexandrium_andersonii.AAC.1
MRGSARSGGSDGSVAPQRRSARSCQKQASLADCARKVPHALSLPSDRAPRPKNSGMGCRGARGAPGSRGGSLGAQLRSSGAPPAGDS